MTSRRASGAGYDVVVCGAGAGGLACARALGGLGLTVLVLDRQQAPPRVAKGGLLQPESVRLLDRWGALDGLRVNGVVPVGRLAIRDPGGGALLTLDYAGLAGEYRQILCTEYPSLLSALHGSLGANVEVCRGVRVAGAVRDASGRVVGVRLSGTARADGAHGDGTILAALVVAADGASSALRRAAGIRARRVAYGHRLLAFDVAGATVADEVCAYRTERGLCLVYPLPGQRCRLYAQVTPDEFRDGGLADLTGWCDRLVAEVPALAPLAGALRASLRSRQLLAVYRLRSPRLAAPGLALVGETAHAVHPMAAQGVNSSLADAEVLAAALGGAAGGLAVGGLTSGAVDHGLREYHDARLPRLDHTATVSHNAARMLTTTAGVGRMLGGRMMRNTAANPRLLRITAGNLAGTDIHPLTLVDRLYQLGLLHDRHAAGNSTVSETR
jgi:2-polyprenyl-6-methoxyphenol hydroxylase-like FAD-dependent oxidoreductase